MPESVSPLVSGFDSPEGPCFDTAGNLYFVNWRSSSIMQRTPDPQGAGMESHNLPRREGSSGGSSGSGGGCGC